MKRSTTLLGVPTLLAAAALAVALYQHSGGAPRQSTPAARPTAVVTVDLTRAIANLNQRAHAEAELKKLVDERDAKRAEYTANAKKVEEQLNALGAKVKEARDAKQDTSRLEAEVQQVIETAAQTRLQFEGWLRFRESQLDIERSLLLRELYTDIKKEVANLASAAGYDLVLVDDSKGEIEIEPRSQVAREIQVRQQMIARRILYVTDAIDITAEVIDRMNNAFAAGIPASAPAPAPGH